jgi:hypothetical protein
MKAIFKLTCKIPGLNGNDGLIREHYRKAMQRKDNYYYLLLTQNQPKFKGEVEIIYTRYTTRLMDWDNHCASFKHIGDALVKIGTIEDDNPKIVVKFIPKQVKVSSKKEECVIIVVSKHALQHIK